MFMLVIIKIGVAKKNLQYYCGHNFFLETIIMSLELLESNGSLEKLPYTSNISNPAWFKRFNKLGKFVNLKVMSLKVWWVCHTLLVIYKTVLFKES